MLVTFTTSPANADEAVKVETARLNWRDATVGKLAEDAMPVSDLLHAASAQSGVPISMIYPLTERDAALKVMVRMSKTTKLGNLLDEVSQKVPGMRLTENHRGIVAELPLPDRSSAILNRPVKEGRFRGSVDEFVSEYIVADCGMFFPPADWVSSLPVDMPVPAGSHVRDVLIKLLQDSGLQFSLAIGEERSLVLGGPGLQVETRSVRQIAFSARPNPWK